MTTSTIMPVVQPVEGEMHPASLAHLHTAIADARDAADGQLERADGGQRTMLEAFRDLHARHDRELVTAMGGHGHHPDDDGSFGSMLQQGIGRLRDMFSGSEPDRIIDAEREVMSAYNHAMTHGGPDDVLGLLSRQMEELEALIGKHDPQVPPTAGAV
jgi:hypothetical protein